MNIDGNVLVCMSLVCLVVIEPSPSARLEIDWNCLWFGSARFSSLLRIANKLTHSKKEGRKKREEDQQTEYSTYTNHQMCTFLAVNHCFSFLLVIVLLFGVWSVDEKIRSKPNPKPKPTLINSSTSKHQINQSTIQLYWH